MKLRIDLSFDADRDGKPEFVAKPVFLPLSDQAATLLGQGIALADLFDAKPGDGRFQVDAEGRIPVRIPIIRRDVDIPFNACVELSVVP